MTPASQTTANRNASRAEWSFLLECAKPAPEVARLASKPLDSLDWRVTVDLADQHGVLGLLAKSVRQSDDSLVPRDVRRKLEDTQRLQTRFTLALTAELFRVLHFFAGENVPVLVTKGPALSQRCYQDPGVRHYGDLDLIVRNADIRRATELMNRLGYGAKVHIRAIDAGKVPGEYLFTHPATRILVEFHTELTFRYHPKPLPIENLFTRQSSVVFDGCAVPALSLEDELLLISIHGAKHFWGRVLWIADVAALATRPEMDWARALDASREVSAARMLYVALHLARELFHISLSELVVKALQSDPKAASVAAEIIGRFPAADFDPKGVFKRAAFRTKMTGGMFSSASYLLRLALSPTEEDWTEAGDPKRSRISDSIARPFRLFRKYGRSATG